MGESTHRIRFEAQSNIADELNKTIQKVQALRRHMESGGQRGVVSAGNTQVIQALNNQIDSLVANTEMAVGSTREMRQSFEEFNTTIRSTGGEIARIEKEFKKEEAALVQKYTKAIKKSKDYKKELKEEQFLRFKSGDYDVAGDTKGQMNTAMKGETGKALFAQITADSEAALAQRVHSDASQMALTGGFGDIADLGQMENAQKFDRFSKALTKASNKLTDFQVGGVVPTTGSLTDLNKKFDQLLVTAQEFEEGILLSTNATEEMQADFNELTSSIEGQRQSLQELTAEHQRQQTVIKELDAVQKKKNREDESKTRKIENDRSNALRHLNNQIRNNITQAEGMSIAWKKLGVNAGLSTRRVMELSHQLREQANAQLVTAGATDYTTKQILEQSNALDLLTGKVAQVNNRMAFMQDSSIKVQNTMRMLSSGMQGTMLAMSAMNGDIMGLAFSLIFMQFSGLLKVSAGFAAVTLAGMAAIKVFQKWKEGRKETEKNNRAWATLTGSVVGYEQAQRRATDYVAGLAMNVKLEKEAVEALTQAQLHLRKARLDATPERMKVALTAFLAAAGYGMEYEEAVQEAIGTTLDFAKEGTLSLDGISHTMQTLTGEADNFLRFMAEHKNEPILPFAHITAADLLLTMEKLNIEVPKLLDEIVSRDPSTKIKDLFSIKDFQKDMLAPINEVFGEDGSGYKTLDSFFKHYPKYVGEYGGSPTINEAFRLFAEDNVKAMTPDETMLETAQTGVNELLKVWDSGRADTVLELEAFRDEIGGLMAEIQAYLALEGAGSGIESLADTLKTLDKQASSNLSGLQTKATNEQWLKDNFTYGSVYGLPMLDNWVLGGSAMTTNQTININATVYGGSEEFIDEVAMQLKTEKVLRT